MLRTVDVPWSDPGSPFAAPFEALVADWPGRGLDLSRDQVDGEAGFRSLRSLRPTPEPCRAALDACPGPETGVPFSVARSVPFSVAIDPSAHFRRAVAEVAVGEAPLLRSRGDESLADTRYFRLYHPDRVPDRSRGRFKELVDWRLEDGPLLASEGVGDADGRPRTASRRRPPTRAGTRGRTAAVWTR